MMDGLVAMIRWKSRDSWGSVNRAKPPREWPHRDLSSLPVR
jgi:hypothetical protein